MSLEPHPKKQPKTRRSDAPGVARVSLPLPVTPVVLSTRVSPPSLRSPSSRSGRVAPTVQLAPGPVREDPFWSDRGVGVVLSVVSEVSPLTDAEQTAPKRRRKRPKPEL